MAEKIFTTLYNVMCWLTWASVIAMLLCMTVFFATGANKAPEINVSSVKISESSPEGEFLSQHGCDASSDWYRADYTVTLQGAKLSPYTFTAEGVKFKNGTAPNGTPFFIVTDKPIKYSKLAPEEITVSLYMQSSSSEEAFSEFAKNAEFSLTGMRAHFSLFSCDITNGTPSFSAKVLS